MHQKIGDIEFLLECYCYFVETAIVLVKLPDFEAAGLIGRVWRRKPNKLPRKVPKIAKRKSILKQKTPGVILSVCERAVLICDLKNNLFQWQ